MMNTKISQIKLANVLNRDGNNFDLLRLIAACAVIVGHAYAIAPQPPLQDSIRSILHFDYSGSLAVKFFFFLSGLLVTNSFINNPDPFSFLIKRALRIFPGLFVCLFVSAYVLGPILTKMSLLDYLMNSQTILYILNNIQLYDLQWRLPHVLDESKYGLNGSLWTLQYEVLCYLYIAILFGLGLIRLFWASNLILLSIIWVSFFMPQIIPYFSSNPESLLLPGVFSLGALFAVNKDSINISIKPVFLLWLFYFLNKNTTANQLIFYVALFYTAIFLSAQSYVRQKMRLPFDASYGVYIYGFIIQQCVNYYLPNVGVHGNQYISILIAITIGVISWRYVEKPAIEIGKKLFDNNLLFMNHKLVKANSIWSRSSLLTVIFIVLSFTYFYSVKNYSSLINDETKNTFSKSESTAEALHTIKVIDWGPKGAIQNKNPNPQPDGGVGVWITVKETRGFGDLKIEVNGIILKTVIQDKAITTSIDPKILTKLGKSEIVIRQSATGQSYSLGKFVVEDAK